MYYIVVNHSGKDTFMPETTLDPPKTWTISVIDFANEPKEYEWWVNVPYVERLAAAHRLTQRIYALQRRVYTDFQPIVTVIDR
jgi:hypothetical protein